MIRLYLPIFLALFILAVPKESVGQNGQLAGLTEVKIVTGALSAKAKELGLSKSQINQQVFVFLRSKLPSLSVSDTATPSIKVMVGLDPIRSSSKRELGYYGTITIKVYRHVLVSKSGKSVIAPVWTDGYSLHGSDSAVSHVRGLLDTLLTSFAADWYRDNPSK